MPGWRIRPGPAAADQSLMAAADDIEARRRRGREELLEAVARAQRARAAAAARIGARPDDDRAPHAERTLAVGRVRLSDD
jgi:hypothetical protein